jgi:quinol monooxygenase YgiN
MGKAMSWVVYEVLTAVPGQKDRLKEYLQKLALLSRKEGGCLRYELYDSAEQSDDILVLMEWTDKADYDRHCDSLHVQQFVKECDQRLYASFHETLWVKFDPVS